MHSFGIVVKDIPAIGLELSSEPQTIKTILGLAVIYFSVSFVFLTWADFIDRPTPAYRKKVWGIWADKFQLSRDFYRSMFVEVIDSHRPHLSMCEIVISEDSDPIFMRDQYLILDEDSYERSADFIDLVERKAGQILTDFQKAAIVKITSDWWRDCQTQYFQTSILFYFYGFVYFASVYALEVVFPVVWALVALSVPDLSWVQNVRF